jgi:hypothetical protein
MANPSVTAHQNQLTNALIHGDDVFAVHARVPDGQGRLLALPTHAPHGAHHTIKTHTTAAQQVPMARAHIRQAPQAQLATQGHRAAAAEGPASCVGARIPRKRHVSRERAPTSARMATGVLSGTGLAASSSTTFLCVSPGHMMFALPPHTARPHRMRISISRSGLRPIKLGHCPTSLYRPPSAPCALSTAPRLLAPSTECLCDGHRVRRFVCVWEGGLSCVCVCVCDYSCVCVCVCLFLCLCRGVGGLYLAIDALDARASYKLQRGSTNSRHLSSRAARSNRTCASAAAGGSTRHMAGAGRSSARDRGETRRGRI